MQITFQYTPQLLQRAHEFHFQKFFPLQGKLPLILGFMSVWAGILLMLILGENGNKWLSGSFVVLGIISMIVYLWMMKTLGRRVYKKLKDYREPIDMQIGDEKIEMTIRGTIYEMPWKDIKKAIVKPDMILLYPTETMFYIFPQKNFKGDEFSGFEKLVREKAQKIY